MRSIYMSIAVLAVGLSACQTLPQVPYDRATAGNVKTIDVVTPAAPSRPNVVLASTVGQSFGLIGALVDAGMQNSRENDFEVEVRSQNFVGRDMFVRYVDEALTANGYKAINDNAPRPQRQFLQAYAAPAGGVPDAYFDIVLDYGYYAAGMSTPYRPYVFVDCKLVRSSDNALLMQKSIFYNPLNKAPDQAVTIAPDSTYEFTDFDALKANPEKAVKGLDSAMRQVASAMGTLLR